MNQQINTDSDSCPSPHGLMNKIGRVLWAAVWLTLFRPSPRIFHRWRCVLLRLFRARIDTNVKIDPSCRIWAPWNLTIGTESSVSHHVDCYNIAPVVIGKHATVSQYAFLCTGSHDVSDPTMQLVSAPIAIEDQAWVCAGVFVAPGRRVGQGAVIAARAVLTRDAEPWGIYGGNPATKIRSRTLRRNG